MAQDSVTDTFVDHLCPLVKADVVDFRREERSILSITHTITHWWLDGTSNRNEAARSVSSRVKDECGVIVTITFVATSGEHTWRMTVTYGGGAYATP